MMAQAVNSKGQPGQELEEPALHGAGCQAVTTRARCPPGAELQSRMAGSPNSCWLRIVVNPPRVSPRVAALGRPPGSLLGLATPVAASGKKGAGLGEGCPATSPYKGQHDLPWTLILFKRALLKA